MEQPSISGSSEHTQYSLAPIETLPAEIIQDIFLRCLNVNLPLASPFISAQLQDFHIYNELCDYAFGYQTPPAFVKPQCSIENQKSLFQKQWMTWSFFEQYLTKRVPPFSCGCPIYIKCTEHGGCSESASGATNPDARQHREPAPRLLDIRGSLPRKLTRGPWTDEKLRFLRCLLRISKMSVDWTDKDAIRTAQQGKRDAIMERNLDAVHTFSRVRRLGKAPNLALVKFAILDAGCDCSIVFNLMTAAREWGHRQWNDSALDAWVAQEEELGNPKAKWLRVKLDELRFGRMPDPATGDYCGMLEVRKAPFRVRLDIIHNHNSNANDLQGAVNTLDKHLSLTEADFPNWRCESSLAGFHPKRIYNFEKKWTSKMIQA
jgi:hypothetical protein